VDLREIPESSGLRIKSHDLYARWKMNLGEDSKNETKQFHFVDFDPKKVANWIYQQQGKVGNSAVACAILCLRSFFDNTDAVFISKISSHHDDGGQSSGVKRQLSTQGDVLHKDKKKKT